MIKSALYSMLFNVDAEFNKDKATERQLMYNKIFPPIIEKDLILESNERSCSQIVELYHQT